MANARQGPSQFVVGIVTAAGESIASGQLAVPARAGDAETLIPITIINGTSPGPVLAFAGEVLYVVSTPPITKGEPVAMIGARK